MPFNPTSPTSSPRPRAARCGLAAFTAGWIALGAAATAQPPRPDGGIPLAATTPRALRTADRLLDAMVRTGELVLVDVRADPLLADRRHERFVQHHRGIEIAGAGATRQTRAGVTVSVFGRVHPDLAVDPAPGLSAAQARAIVATRHGAPAASARTELLLLPDAAGAVRLAHRVMGPGPRGPRMTAVDAHTGVVLWEHDIIRTGQALSSCDRCAVGAGTGVKGDRKKVSVRRSDSGFRTVDGLRPAPITTYDLAGDWVRLLAILNGEDDFRMSDIGFDRDNTWNDPLLVDGHTGVGWTYDYLVERFGWAGLDGRNRPIVDVVHPVRLEDLEAVPTDVALLFHLNAFFCSQCGPHGIAVFGEGLPPGRVLGSTGQSVAPFAAALDVVAHELTHGLIDLTSRLIYQGESGALSEAFSDIIGISLKFFMADSGRHRAERTDYVFGDEAVQPGGIRSLRDPRSLGDPDHYSIRVVGPADSGGVHTNSSIASHAFFLAIEGGTNRTSGRSVTGVGSRRRAEVERAFFRAFTLLMPMDATFAVARATTLQSARDLFGVRSDEERAIADAWSAVGVECSQC